MVPLRGSPQSPCFPQCIEWILQNQNNNGSWGINPLGSTVNKDILLSTLACVLALKKWNTGRDNIRKGLSFIGKNFSVAMDDKLVAPVGFNITFSGLLSLATRMGLEIPVTQADIDGIFHLRKIELERDAGGTVSARKAFMAYVSEGLGSLQDWDFIMTNQRKNGSLFDSPSTTAMAAIHIYDDKALNYLDALANKSGGSGGPIVLTAMYLVGPELSEEVVRSKEYKDMFMNMSVAGRLLNDVQTYEREIKQGKINSVMLQALSRDGSSPSPSSIEEAKRELRSVIEACRLELQRLVFREGGVVPRPCRELFWLMSKVVNIYYLEEDGYFTPDEMMSKANAVIIDPLQVTLPPSC
uniref:Terpene synthase N-terminal domain-containing protein n=1 Tax=Leersia perrieri TaxID=77586 RepID=A0A0D9WQV3_9ORYZ